MRLSTSAQALNEILAAVSKATPDTVRFISAVANHLDIAEDNAEAEAAKLLISLITRVRGDIDSSGLDDKTKKQMLVYVSHFDGLVSFNHMHLDLRNAKNNFLKPTNLVDLINVHAALSGHCDLPNLDPMCKEIARNLREIASKISDFEMPLNIKKSLYRRVVQVASALENYHAFGLDALEEELEGLVGSILVNAPSSSKTDKSTLKNIAEYASAAIDKVKSANQGVDAALQLAKKAQNLIDFL